MAADFLLETMQSRIKAPTSLTYDKKKPCQPRTLHPMIETVQSGIKAPTSLTYDKKKPCRPRTLHPMKVFQKLRRFKS